MTVSRIESGVGSWCVSDTVDAEVPEEAGKRCQIVGVGTVGLNRAEQWAKPQ